MRSGTIPDGDKRWLLKTEIIASFSVRDSKRLQADIQKTVSADDANVIICGLDSLGLVSLTSEAPLSAMTWLAVHNMRSQLFEQIRTSHGIMHSGFESRKMSQEMMNDSRVIKLSMFSLTIRFSTLSH